MTGNDVTATGYLVVKGGRNSYGRPNDETGLRPIVSAKLTTVRQSRPTSLERDEVLIKVRVQVPASVFDPIMPQALIVVAEDMVLDRYEIVADATGEDTP